FAYPFPEEDLVSAWDSSAEKSPETVDSWNDETVTAAPETDKSAVKEEPNTVAPVAADEWKGKEPATVKSAAKAVTGTTIKQRTGRFYVIMGVFTQDGYAERNLK